MRHEQGRRRALQQGVAPEGAVLVDTGALLRQALALDAIEGLDRRVRRQARPDAGECVLARPIEQVREPPPVGLIRKARRPRLGAGDDDGVQGRLHQFFQGPVAALDMGEGLGSPRQLGKGGQAHSHGVSAAAPASSPQNCALVDWSAESGMLLMSPTRIPAAAAERPTMVRGDAESVLRGSRVTGMIFHLFFNGLFCDGVRRPSQATDVSSVNQITVWPQGKLIRGSR